MGGGGGGGGALLVLVASMPKSMAMGERQRDCDVLIASTVMAVETGTALTKLACLEALAVGLQAVRLLAPAAALPAAPLTMLQRNQICQQLQHWLPDPGTAAHGAL